MRTRCFMRRIRCDLGLSLGDVQARTRIARGELSMFERGHSIPRDDQVALLEPVYGPAATWWPATVWRALQPDAGDCENCGDELEPDASRSRRYHDDACRDEARRTRNSSATVV